MLVRIHYLKTDLDFNTFLKNTILEANMLLTKIAIPISLIQTNLLSKMLQTSSQQGTNVNLQIIAV